MSDRLLTAMRPFATFALEARATLEQPGSGIWVARREGHRIVTVATLDGPDFIRLLDAYVATDPLMQHGMSTAKPAASKARWQRIRERFGPFSFWSYGLGFVVAALLELVP